MQRIAKNNLFTYDKDGTEITVVRHNSELQFVVEEVLESILVTNDMLLTVFGTENLSDAWTETGWPLHLVNQKGIENLSHWLSGFAKNTNTFYQTIVPQAIKEKYSDELKIQELKEEISKVETEIGELKIELAALEKENIQDMSSRYVPGVGYDNSVKQQILDYCNAGGTIKGAVRLFGVSRPTIRKYLRTAEAGKNGSPSKVVSITSKELAQEIDETKNYRSKKKITTMPMLSTDITESDIREQWRAWCRGMVSKIAFKIHEGDSMLSEEQIRRVIWGQLYDALTKEFKINFNNERAHLRCTKRNASFLDVIEKKNNPKMIEMLIGLVKKRAIANNVNFEVVGLRKKPAA